MPENVSALLFFRAERGLKREWRAICTNRYFDLCSSAFCIGLVIERKSALFCHAQYELRPQRSSAAPEQYTRARARDAPSTVVQTATPHIMDFSLNHRRKQLAETETVPASYYLPHSSNSAPPTLPSPYRPGGELCAANRNRSEGATRY